MMEEMTITVNQTELIVQPNDRVLVLKYFNEEEKKPYYAVEQYRVNPRTGLEELIYKEGEA